MGKRKNKRPDLGDVVEISAVDWGIHIEQMSAESAFDIVRAWLYGQVVRMTDDAITIAPQVFAPDDVRFALSVPWVTIGQITILKHAED